MDIKAFVNITSRAWSLSILAQLHAGTAARQAPLLLATGAGRTAFAQSMDHLIENGMVERNPGYGHPLRPEFRLTVLGISAAKLAYQIQQMTNAEEQKLLRRTWTLPVLISLSGPRYFGDIRRSLPMITDRALSQSLQLMEAQRWVDRHVDERLRPPKPVYHAINVGAQISRAANMQIQY